MEIQRSGVQPSGKGSSDYFTGAVRHDPLFSPPGPARVSGALVTFEPGARTVMAYASTGSDADCHGGLRLGST
jgi:quercetin dioxygenase-like cupin family protein